VLKRIALVLALVAALVPVGAAWAGSTGFFGKFENGGTVTFALETPGAGGTQYLVHDWAWDNLKIKCHNGKHRYDGNFIDALTVNPDTRRFSKRALNRWGGKAILHGEFDETYASATGTFKIKGRTAVGKRCRSGEALWTADEVPPPAE
jgi:hypothetical protein